MLETTNSEIRLEDRVCSALMIAIFLTILALGIDYGKLHPHAAPYEPPCEYHCR